MDVRGKVALVSGASGGIGAVVAERLAQRGADVALLARSTEGLERVAARVRAHGARALVVRADVTDRAAVAAAVERCERELGGLDVLVSCAGSLVYGRFEEVEPDDFDRAIAVTFTGAVNVVRSALAPLARRGGTIVVVGSVLGSAPFPAMGSYCAAKYALRGFLGSLRTELRAAGRPVTVSLVKPGPVDTPLWTRMSTATGRLPLKPLPAYGPESVAEVVLECVRRPRAEVTVGAEGRLLELAWAWARPLTERVLALMHRRYRGGKAPAHGPGALWEPSGTGEARDGMHGRPSVTAALWRAGRR